MAKIMVFIDGSWLYRNMPRLANTFGDPGYRIDFGLLPQVLAQRVGEQLFSKEAEVVRTYLYASYPSNYHPADEHTVERQCDFLSMLTEEFHYEVEAYPIDFRGRRVRREDRDPNDEFQPQEKCVDIALAASMLYMGATPNCYDIALALVGDRDFVPVLQHVRRLGKRVAIASIKGSCAGELADYSNRARVKDFDVIWVDELLKAIELKYDAHQLECQSPMHQGDRLVWTEFHPRKGQRFYCDQCREEFSGQKTESEAQYVNLRPAAPIDEEPAANIPPGTKRVGEVCRIISDRGFGFIATGDSTNYYFHFTDLTADLEFADMAVGDAVEFEIKRPPSHDKAGAAQMVRSASKSA